MLRAINGNQTGSGAGSELWAFVAPEHFASLNRLRENDPQVRYPSTPAAVAGAIPRNYYFDGPIGAYQNTATNEVLLFPGMRRGGRAIYAFNATDPDQPRLLWRINHTMTDYASLGQTWSMPRISRIKGSTDPVLIMGGGYDPVAEDASPAGASTVGRGVYVINMRTGARLGCSRPTTACQPTCRLWTPTVTGTWIASMSSMCALSCIESTSKMLLGAARPVSAVANHKNCRTERRHWRYRRHPQGVLCA